MMHSVFREAVNISPTFTRPFSMTTKLVKNFGTRRIITLSVRPLTSNYSIGREKALDFQSETNPTNDKGDKSGDIYKELISICRENHAEDGSSQRKGRSLLNQVQPENFIEDKKHDQYQSIINSKGLNLAQQLQALTKKTGQKEITEKVYNHLMHLYALQGNYEMAQNIFNLMVKKGVMPDFRTYHTLMNAYSNGGELAKTIEVFELIRKNPAYLNPHPYSILIKAYMKHRRVQDAFDVIGIMKQKMAPNEYVYTALIQACVEARDIDMAWAAYELMGKDECQPNLLTYTILISIAQRRDLGIALDLFEEMVDRGFMPGLKALNSLLAALASRPEYYGSLLDLINILIVKQDFKPDNITFGIMLRGAQMSRNLGDAKIFFNKILNSNPLGEILQSAISVMFLAYSQAFPVDKQERLLGSLEINPSLAFLSQPAPLFIQDCVIEAQQLSAYFEIHLQKILTPLQVKSIRESFFKILTCYSYFTNALKYYNQYFSGGNTPHSSVLSALLGMCVRINKRGAFYSTLKQVDILLAPISPNSKLSMREKTEYKHATQLVAGPLIDLYQSTIVGLAKFGDVENALRYFEIQCQDPDLKRPDPKNYYPIFFKIVRNSQNASYVSRLNHLMTTYKPQFC